MTSNMVLDAGSTMQRDNELHISEYAPFYGLAVSFGGIRPKRKSVGIDSPILVTLVLGFASAFLYFLLYQYQHDLVHFAEMTRQGNKLSFALPIGIALAFSFVHGAFTGHFWEALGLKAKK